MCLFLEEEREYISTIVPLRNSQNSALEKVTGLLPTGKRPLFQLIMAKIAVAFGLLLYATN